MFCKHLQINSLQKQVLLCLCQNEGAKQGVIRYLTITQQIKNRHPARILCLVPQKFTIKNYLWTYTN